jgi:parvulin-like peptidyl-prolyl isomerase
LAKKQKKSEIKRKPTAHQISKWERQKKNQRIIMFVGLAFIVIVLGFIGYGYYDSAIRPFQRPVLQVDSITYDMDYYLKIMSVYLKGATSDENGFQMANIIKEKMIDDALVMQKTSGLGISVSDKEIDDLISQYKLPNDKNYRMMITADTLTQKLEEYFSSKLPASVDQINLRAIFADSEDNAKAAIAMASTSDNFTAIVEKYNVEPKIKEVNGNLGWMPKGYVNVLNWYPLDGKLDDVAFKLNKGEISQPVFDPSITKSSGYWILKVMEKDEDISNRVSGILLGSYSEATEVKSRLEKGEDFASLVKEKSQDAASKETKGDLGWLHRGSGNELINNAALSLDAVGKISIPVADSSVQTKGGYWVAKAIDKEANKTLADATKNSIIQMKYSDWIEETRKSSIIKEYITDEEKTNIASTIIKAALSSK